MAAWSWPICVCSNGSCQMTDYYDTDGTVDDAEVAADGSCKAKDPHFPDESPKYPVESLFATRSRAKNVDENGLVHVSPRLAPQELREQAQVAKYGMDMEKRVAHADAIEAKLRRVRLSYSSRPSSMESRPASMDALDINGGVTANPTVSTAACDAKVGEANSTEDASVNKPPLRQAPAAVQCDVQQQEQELQRTQGPTVHDEQKDHLVCSPKRSTEAFPSMTPGRSPTLADALKLADVAIAWCKDRSGRDDGDCHASPPADATSCADEAAETDTAEPATVEPGDCSLVPANLDAMLQDEEQHSPNAAQTLEDTVVSDMTAQDASVTKHVRVLGQLDLEASCERCPGTKISDATTDLETMWQLEVDGKQSAAALSSSQATSAVFVPFTPQLDANQLTFPDQQGALKSEIPLEESVRSANDISGISRIDASDNATDVTADSPCRQLDMSSVAGSCSGQRQHLPSPPLDSKGHAQDSPLAAAVAFEKLPAHVSVSPRVGGA